MHPAAEITRKIVWRGTTFARKVYPFQFCSTQCLIRRASTECRSSQKSYRNQSSWLEETIKSHVGNGCFEEAISAYHQMRRQGIKPSRYTFPSLVKACASLSDLHQGKRIHGNILKNPSLQRDPLIANALITMYCRSGSLDAGRQLFDGMPRRNVNSWNAIIGGYAKILHEFEALNLLNDMLIGSFRPDSFTIATLLSGFMDLENGMQIHALALKSGLLQDVHVGTALVHLYAKLGSFEDALFLFGAMQVRNVVSWNAMIAGFCQHRLDGEALRFFSQMQQKDEAKSDAATLASALSACSHLQALRAGREIHAHIVRTDLVVHVFVASALVDMYTKCGTLQGSRDVFDRLPSKNVVSWNALVSGYARDEQHEQCLELFKQMMMAGLKPDSASVTLILSACAKLQACQRGMGLHGYVVKAGMESDKLASCALIDLYVKCHMMVSADNVLWQIGEKDPVHWSALISGKIQHGKADDAMKLFVQMQQENPENRPTTESISSVLPACAEVAALRKGKSVHCQAMKFLLDWDVFVGSALVDMYAKCGDIENALVTFQRLPERNVVTWNAMIAGYGIHGLGSHAVKLFDSMQEGGFQPNSSTFVALLTACGHSGLVDQGWNFFKIMHTRYGIDPTVEHYTCMVDILGRAGLLNQANSLIQNMPKKPDCALWGSLLTACSIHGNIDLGLYAIQHITEFQPQEPGYYVLMANMCSLAGRWDEAEKMRTLIKSLYPKKVPGCSWIESDNKTSAFVVDGSYYPKFKEIHTLLIKLDGEMKERAFRHETYMVTQDIENEDKEFCLSYHSEKLAIAFGLINEAPEVPIRVHKNIRVCGNCHEACKLISKICEREIILRDAVRFHHFNEGFCSCHDYW